jgi:hypothetical protein
MAFFLQSRKSVSLLKVTEFCSDVYEMLVRNSSEAQSDTQPQPSMIVLKLFCQLYARSVYLPLHSLQHYYKATSYG